ncbi:zinc ABC transporter substrate-binding protein [Paenibacillus sp. F411]|uniref:metal ABC transporter solute-binding protein, Zn/Mn family n=1 Tax=Paenibacillus sp. F411 TaxID=2820239 RepID=UPI001AAFEA65|nr:zinc ABC transporter substrate-binding protein [Paenibacillus sp. F411]MBO2942931.1 zinc ABC transporter substrate-binding protein [Paenibacillus sp. F411]
MLSQMKKVWIPAMLILVLALAGCAGSNEKNGSTAEGKINIVTTIAQIAEPVSVIGGDKVQVSSLMGPGVDPHLYNATQGDISKLDQADIVFYSGLHLEGNMTEVFEQIGKSRPVVAISESVSEDQLLTDDTGAIDPHVWFDLELWEVSLTAAVEEMKTFAPEHAEEFENNKLKYFEELQALKQEAQEKLASIPENHRVIVTAHDAFGYFGRAYDMEVVGLQGLSTEDEISVSDIDQTIDILMQHQVPAVFVESSINSKSVEAVVEGASSKGLDVKLGGELFSDAMGDEGTAEGTYLGMYRHNVNIIYEALAGKGE